MGSKIKTIALLGSTGSIGRQTLDIVRAFPERLKIVGLGAGSNSELLSRQALEFQPQWLSLQTAEKFNHSGSAWVSMEEIACLPQADLVIVATAGIAGLLPTLAAIRAGKSVALANKEVLVAAGALVIAEAEKHRVTILPMDSEHSAIWQCLQGEEGKIARILLTASGGPFRTYSAGRLSRVTVTEALKHPVWQMGRKVTVDSATLMNKGMEVIEARWLFNLSWDKIQIVLHPQSMIHSLVEFEDGSTKAQLAPPDMRLPILYALSHPQRWNWPYLPRLNWEQPVTFTFEPPDLALFPCLGLALEAGKAGGTYPAVLSAADEVAVELFLSEHIGFTDIPKIIELTLSKYAGQSHDKSLTSLESVLEADTFGRTRARELAGALIN